MVKYLSTILLLILFTPSAYADGYWLEVKGTGILHDSLSIKVRYGGVDENQKRYINKGADLDKMKAFVVWVESPDGKKEYVTIQQHYDSWYGAYLPKQKGRYRIFAYDKELPVVERKDSLQNIKPIQYLCTSYMVGANQPTVVKKQQFLDMQVNLNEDTVTVKAFKDGKQLSQGTKLRILFPDNHDEVINVQNDNQVKIPLKTKGVHLIRIVWEDHKSGIYKGAKYYSTRHRYDYTLYYD